ncbi:MAG: 50S ribosomal protein L25 [Anaerolineales bacterium]|nr:50S ribosomal protein L25 [Anaerolineales bacterium]
MEEIVLQATTREIVGKQVRALRREGKLPAVIYGHHLGALPISLDFHDASRALSGVAGSQLVAVVIDGTNKQPTLIREKQRDPITGRLLHVDFLAVSMTEKLRAMVRINLVGEAPAVKNYDAIMVTGQEEVEVESLPGDLPESIEVDLAVLKEIGDGIHVRDLPVLSGVEILTDPNEMIVLMTAPTIAPVEEVEEAAASSEPEVIERGKREEDF